jgi:four helix bundle protein
LLKRPHARSGKMFRFERLKVWHKAVELYDVVDKVAEGFPARVQFSIADQLRRAALSIPSNIAEGCGRETSKDSRHFYSVAKGSTFEVVSTASVCERRGLMAAEQYQEIYGRAEEVSKMLTGLKRFPGTA